MIWSWERVRVWVSTGNHPQARQFLRPPSRRDVERPGVDEPSVRASDGNRGRNRARSKGAARPDPTDDDTTPRRTGACASGGGANLRCRAKRLLLLARATRYA